MCLCISNSVLSASLFYNFLLPLHLCMCILFPCLLFYSRFSFSRYLHATGHQYGRPIAGQKEISAHAYKSDNNLWKALVIYSMYMFHWFHLANDKTRNSERKLFTFLRHCDEQLYYPGGCLLLFVEPINGQQHCFRLS